MILLVGLSCLFLLVLTGPVDQFPRKRRRREVGGEREGSGGGAGVSGGGLDHGGLGALGDGEEGSGEGNGGKRKGVKESRGTYFFCKYSSFFS